MKRLWTVLFALAAGCVTVPTPMRGNAADAVPETAEEREAKEIVRESFEVLRKAWSEGDALQSLYMMSRQAVSDWVLTRTRDTSDPDWKKLSARMGAALKVDFDVWLRDNKNIRVPFMNERAIHLPQSVLESEWLRESWKHYAALDKEGREVAKAMEVSEIYVDGHEASVLVKMGRTPSRLYSMVLEGRWWKFDYFVKPGGEVK